jgi:hypothetical protein
MHNEFTAVSNAMTNGTLRIHPRFPAPTAKAGQRMKRAKTSPRQSRSFSRIGVKTGCEGYLQTPNARR